MTSTELFHRDGKLFAILTEADDGRVLTQEWRYAEGCAPFAGAEPGCTEINVRLSLKPGDVATENDIDALIDAWCAAVSKPGFRNAGRDGEEGARAFLVQTKGWGVLHATTRA